MITFNDINDAVTGLALMKDLYLAMRIVDPVSKEVPYTYGETNDIDSSKCYQIWRKNRACKNCISMRAVNEKIAAIKIIISNHMICFVTAMPIYIDGKEFALELVQNATGRMIIESDAVCKDADPILSSVSDYLERLLICDELTGLYNRRFIDEQFPAALNHAQNYKTPLSIVYADIDFFKNVNDTYGHVAGDQVLKDMANLLRSNIRDNDSWVARYGGEEFLICLPGINNESAKKIAERIRIAIMKNDFKVGSTVISVTCSFGVYTVQEEDSELTAQGVISLADSNLYKAKTTGRNKVV